MGKMMNVNLDWEERKKFPNFPNRIPMYLFNEEWAEKIHDQTLQRLNERGGLHPCEMVMNIKRYNLRECIDNWNTEKAMNELLEIIKHKELNGE